MSDTPAPKKRGNPALVKGGPSLNPKGRPVGSSSIKTQIQEAFLQMMKTEVTVGKKKELFFNAYNEAFARDALRPGSQAFKFMAERLYGMDILSDIDNQVNRSKREDTDFATYRVYKRAFDIQQRVLMSKARDIGLMAGRRGGKSETNKLKAISQCVSEPNQRVLVIGLTIMKTQQIYWDDMVKILDELGFDYEAKQTESQITFGNGSFIQFGGNSNKNEREKYRGQHWDGIIIDEAQSQPELGMFIKEIINPMLLDTNGWLMLTGSGPRTRGTYWEQYFNNPSPSGLRLNWNLSQNPHIYNYQTVLEDERAKHGLTETDPLFMREYLGLIVYDDDALVYRFNDDNYFTDEQLTAWIEGQPREDIRFTAGLDYGVVDSDAFVIVMYSERRNEKFVIYEYKKAGTDVTTLAAAIQTGLEYVQKNSLFKDCYRKDVMIWADTNEQRTAHEITNRHGIIINNAYKYDKSLAIQMLQEETRKRNLKVRKGSAFDEESLRIIFKRVEMEGQPSIITREIDDEVFHPDMMDAILYSLRHYWMEHAQDHHSNPDPLPTREQRITNFEMPEQLSDFGAQQLY